MEVIDLGHQRRSVEFRCRICGEEASDPCRYAGDASGFAHTLEWLAREPGNDPKNPLLLANAPARGEERWLSVRFPFFAANEPFWCLYLPPLSHHNGWDDQPQEIPESAVVKCRLLEVKGLDAASARIRVEVLRRVLVPDIANEFDQSDGWLNQLEMFDRRRSPSSRFDRFHHLSYSLEGDAGSWAIVEHRDGGYRLLLSGDWGWHMDRFSIENRRLTSAESAIVARLTAEEPDG